MKYEVHVGQETYIMTIDEFKAWFDMFLADKTLGSEFKVIRRAR
ncbi:hypothetical protein HWC33_gp14 [Microbacterium phage TinyTimothy]|uniref:Uncharacterized protein n=2 Tax=Tinytimothyvirus tinytimothy TaxID=2845596 RepID=A0A5Q2WH15_9CAUD|nr:hypothetical protein HWC33_gp14 [Microbacterium phage TinyTimothy]QDF16967.1 hypothetical protein SEA_TINYTIMOTHY_14 [Microbacterium phage TinyTimothy]QGH78655.1 hypothetical protein SEA_WESAK_14 [Microbacterium phage Wesak]